MKKMNFFKGKAKVVFAGTFLAGIILTGNVFATTTELKIDTSEAFEKWKNLSDDQKSKIEMPRTYDVDIPDSILSEYELDTMPRILNQLLGNSDSPFNRLGSVNDSRFNLAERLNLRVEHQGSTTECWAFSLLKGLETNKALKNGLTNIEDFSERHMDYATARTFTDGINEAGFYREVGKGGLFSVGLAYLVNGQGAVLESDMPFKDEERMISLSEIDKNVDTIVNNYYTLPTIHKEYNVDDKGNTVSVKYKKANGTEYTESELKAVRNIIKEHLIKNGTISSMTAGNCTQFYNNTNIFKSTAYNCNITTKIRDHAITIVGWDDNYPKENFGDGKMPSTDGAYIVLNTYGEDSFDNGYMYISYEDYFIEEEIYGIESTGTVDYEKIYQNDYYGGAFKVGLDSQLKGGIGTVYTRDTNKKEILNSIGVTLANYANIEIYVNPKGASFASNELIKVGETREALTPGFHRMNITPTELTGEEFAIVIKQVSESDGFYFQLEANMPNTSYALVDSENRSYVSFNGTTWTNISNLTVNNLDMEKADVCIKAYTVEKENIDDQDDPEDIPQDIPEEPEEPEIEELELTSEKYTITTDRYVMNVTHNTTKEEFLNNIQIRSGKNVIDIDGNIIKDNDIVKTGMKLRLSDGRIYTIVVRGDTNMDGQITLTDLSKLILHYNGVKGFELQGEMLKGADMNIDGKISLVDVSQLVVLYNSI